MQAANFCKQFNKLMKKIFHRLISFKAAIWTVIILSSAIILFHFLVLLQIIPFEHVWAGKLKSVNDMYVYECISIIVNCLLILITLIKAQMIKLPVSPKAINVLLWIFVILFILNTLGNLTSKTSLETIIATPLTFLFALLCLRIVTDTERK